MGMYPNVRNKTLRPLFNNTAGSDKQERENAYWEGYLNNDDAYMTHGYDYATEVVDTFFHNLDVFEEEFELLDLERYDLPDEHIVFGEKALSEYSEEELARMSETTKIMTLMRTSILKWLEIERDELVVGLIEQCPDDEYNDIKERADKGEYENVVIKAMK